MNILIIGGSGHVSGAVARSALNAGNKVWTVTRGKRPMIEGVTPLIADRTDDDSLRTVVEDQKIEWDLVIDCICYDLPDIKQDIELFQNCAKHFVLVSTDFVYDPAQRSFPQPEETDHYVTDEINAAYGYKKRLCELELINKDSGNMKWTIFRPCHIYGPTSELGCLPTHGRDPELIEKLRAGTPVQLVGGGHFLQQPIFSDDLADTIISAAGNSDVNRKIFNMAGPDIIESWQYYQIIADVLGVNLEVDEISVKKFLAENPGKMSFICHRIYDLSRLKSFGLKTPAIPIADGLRLHVEGLLERKP